MNAGDPEQVEGTVNKEPPRSGFLPIATNSFDRVFISTIVLIAIHLFWMRFIEAYIPLMGATAISILVGIFIVARG